MQQRPVLMTTYLIFKGSSNGNCLSTGALHGGFLTQSGSPMSLRALKRMTPRVGSHSSTGVPSSSSPYSPPVCLSSA